MLAVVSACGDPYSASAEPPSADASDAGEGAVDTGPPPDPCGHVLPPAPPVTDDAPTVELPPFFVAIPSLSVTTEGKGVPGFEHDRVCTCDPRPETAHAGTGSCLRKGAACDVDGGVDNSVALLISQLSPFYDVDSVPNNLIARGRRTVLVQIGRYNGLANDKEIAVGLALSDGVRDMGCPGSVEDPAIGVFSPGWCGDDRWSLVPDAVIPTTKQPLIQGVGYVTDGVLTVQLTSQLAIPFTETSVLAIGSPIITATLVPLHENLTARDRSAPSTEKEKRLWAWSNATVSGRVKAVDLLGALGTIDQGDGGAPLCTTALFSTVREQICDGVDIAASKALDFDPQAQCDALSAGLAFTAFPVLPGDVRSDAPKFNPCVAGPDGTPEAGTATTYKCTVK
jgi:hypothetical protein